MSTETQARDVEVCWQGLRDTYRVYDNGAVYRTSSGIEYNETHNSSLSAAIRRIAELEEERERRVESVLLGILRQCEWSYEDGGYGDDALRITFPAGFVLPTPNDDDLLTVSSQEMAKAFAEAFAANR